MGAIRDLVETVAPLPEPVLIQGETGTGKERIAEALHTASGRRGALVPLNCAAIPKDLVEAELFGHSRGAFSGSDRARTGLFRAADGGTLLLDELGDLPLPVQAKLLRVLESGEVRPVGEDHPIFVSVRVVAATNLKLDDLVRAGRFRADLLHRIAAWKIEVPPLRERRGDIPALAAHFLPADAPVFSVEAMEQLLAWDFPGNVRELVNVVRTSAARAQAARAPCINPEHVSPGASDPHPSQPPPANSQADVMRARIETALRLREGNVAQVARDLGVGRPALYQTLKRLGIDPSAYRKP
jgi:transcriptional regulator with GAF, ATPase, and Fis domain